MTKHLLALTLFINIYHHWMGWASALVWEGVYVKELIQLLMVEWTFLPSVIYLFNIVINKDFCVAHFVLIRLFLHDIWLFIVHNHKDKFLKLRVTLNYFMQKHLAFSQFLKVLTDIANPDYTDDRDIFQKQFNSKLVSCWKIICALLSWINEISSHFPTSKFSFLDNHFLIKTNCGIKTYIPRINIWILWCFLFLIILLLPSFIWYLWIIQQMRFSCSSHAQHKNIIFTLFNSKNVSHFNLYLFVMN